MKKLSLILITIILVSCKSEPNNTLKKETADTTPTFDINYIKSKTSSLSKQITVDKINVKSLNKIPKEFYTTYITPVKIDIGHFRSLKANEDYMFHGFKKYENFYLYTFIHDSESCCRTLFAVTLEKNNLKPINIAEIAHTSGDGSWVAEKYGEWVDDYNIENTNINIIHQGLIEQGGKSKIDTTWSKIELNKKGVFKYTKQRQVKYIGAKQIM